VNDCERCNKSTGTRLGVKYFKYLNMNTNTLKIWNTNANTYTKDVFQIQIQILLKVFKYFYDFNYTSYATTQHLTVIMLF